MTAISWWSSCWSVSCHRLHICCLEHEKSIKNTRNDSLRNISFITMAPLEIKMKMGLPDFLSQNPQCTSGNVIVWFVWTYLTTKSYTQHQIDCISYWLTCRCVQVWVQSRFIIGNWFFLRYHFYAMVLIVGINVINKPSLDLSQSLQLYLELPILLNHMMITNSSRPSFTICPINGLQMVTVYICQFILSGHCLLGREMASASVTLIKMNDCYLIDMAQQSMFHGNRLIYSMMRYRHRHSR